MAEEGVEKYNSSGKSYNGEKAVISLTSWRARIGTVSKTLYSLLKMCPGFHIVLVLSEEEFPKKEAELPENLMLFVNCGLIELLWVYKNYKSFKKVLFTMDKYRDVPVISADDDCIYIENYAQELYNKWLENKMHIISYSAKHYYDKIYVCCGPCTLYPPKYFNIDLSILEYAMFIQPTMDDFFIASINKKKPIALNRKKLPFRFHDAIYGLSDSKAYTVKEKKIYFEFYKGIFTKYNE